MLKVMTNSRSSGESLAYNRNLAKDVMCILEELQTHLSNKLKLPFKHLDNTLSMAAIDEENGLVNFALYKKFVVCVMSETSEASAKRIMKDAVKNFVVNLSNTYAIEKIKKRQPEFKQFTIPICDQDKDWYQV